MDEDLKNAFLALVQNNVTANREWTVAAVELLNAVGDAIRKDTEYMRQSMMRMEQLISQLGGTMETKTLHEITKPQDKAVKSRKNDDRTRERYPASFYFRHKFPQDVEQPEYYLVIEQADEQLHYVLYDHQWNAMHSGILSDPSLDRDQAVAEVCELEGILADYVYTEHTKNSEEKPDVQTATEQPEEPETQKETKKETMNNQKTR